MVLHFFSKNYEKFIIHVPCSNSLQRIKKRKEGLPSLLFFLDFTFFQEYNKDIKKERINYEICNQELY